MISRSGFGTRPMQLEELDRLDRDQEIDLIRQIQGEFGNVLPKSLFVEALLQLLEDVPGFELPNDTAIRRLTEIFWNTYQSPMPLANED